MVKVSTNGESTYHRLALKYHRYGTLFDEVSALETEQERF